MKVEKNTATKPARVSPKMSSTNRFHSTAAKLPDRRSFPQLRTDVDTQGEKHHWSLHRSFIDPSLIPSSILHRPFISPRPPQDRPKTTQRPRQDRPLKKYRFFIKNIDFSLEKCRFGAKKGVLHYVLRRDLVIFAKSDHFELEICVKAKKGRTALQPEALLSLKW